MAYDISNYKTLGLLEELIDVTDPKRPTDAEVAIVKAAVVKAIDTARREGVGLSNRLGSPNRASTSLVRERMRAKWNAA